MGVLATDQQVRYSQGNAAVTNLHHRIQEIETAYSSLGTFMRDLISSRREELSSVGASRDDILSLMIQSSKEEKYAMSDSELVSKISAESRRTPLMLYLHIMQLGNTFLLLSAGHGV